MKGGGDRPFCLRGDGLAWRIDAGSVDVFSAEEDAAGDFCHREHLFTVGAGEALFSLSRNGAPDGPAILAVAAIGSAIDRVPAASLLTGDLADAWIGHLAEALGEPLRPRVHRTLEAGARLDLDAGAAVCAAGPPVWVELEGGDVLLLGDDAFPATAGEGLVPLAGHAWLVAGVGGASMRGRSSAALLGEGRLDGALTGFHRAFLGVVGIRRARRALDEERRLELARDRDRAALAEAVSGLSSLLAPRRAPALAGDEHGLYAACRLVCTAAGVTLAAPAGPGGLDALIESARLRVRKVHLPDRWWHADLGPLLAFHADDHRPLALVPRARGGYEIHDVARGAHVRLTAESAAALEPFGYMFYRRLPTEPVDARGLIAFALRGRGRDLLSIALMGLAGGLLGVVGPVATGLVFDAVIPGAERGQLLYVVAALLTTAVCATLFEIARGLGLLRLEGRTGAALQAAVWDRLIDLPVDFFRGYTAGDLADRAGGIDTIRHELSAQVVTMVLGTTFGLCNAALLFFFDVHLALYASALLAVPIVVALAVGAHLLRLLGPATAIQGRLSGLVLQLVRGVGKLRASGAELRAYARWAALFQEQRAIALRTRAPMQVFGAFYPIVATLVVYTLVIHDPATQLSTGGFIAFLGAFNTVLLGIVSTATATLSILHIVPTFRRLRPILETRPEIDEHKADPGDLDGEIELAHVSFRYGVSGPPTLGDIQLRIRPGEFLAVVGASGSGKSTLLRLLLGFERPTAGKIYYSGQDLEHVDLRRVRRQIGVVLQNGQLLPGDILSNVIGSSEVDRDAAIRALSLAGLGDDIDAMPMGLATVVSEGGSTLSGGQRQRLLIARAIVRRPRILLFDEATSALDNQTQAHVAGSIAGLEATRVVVAHRLSTIQGADRIVVLAGGRVAQVGTYAELVGQPGVFADLARRQLM